MKKILSIMFLFVLLANSCSEDELVKKQPVASDSLKFTASFELDESRTYVEKGRLLRWTAGDQISLFVANTLNRQYQFDGYTGDNGGTFSEVGSSSVTGNGALDCHYAVYPYDVDMTITANGTITATLPAEQSYAENSFGLGANTMVAVTQDTDDTFLNFRNLCGYLKLQLNGENIIVKSIELKGNSNEKIAGKATVKADHVGEPIVCMADDATKTITLDCGEGVKIGSTEKTATAFWIVIPPTVFENGFTIIVTDTNEDKFIKSTDNNILVQRNVINTMTAVKVNMESLSLPSGAVFNSSVSTFLQNNPNLDKIKFVANSETTSDIILCTDEDGTKAYLVANGEWLEIHTSANHFKANTDCSFMFAGYDNYGEYSNLSKITNIDLGVYFNTSNVTDMSYMFADCTLLSSLDVSKLNTENVIDMSCMFSYCSSLMLLDVSGFDTANVKEMSNMFCGCSKLSSIDLAGFNTANVTSMNGMFYNCKELSLLNVRGFQTNNVIDMGGMFSYCSSLTSLDVSSFNTTNVINMNGMFELCSSLTTLDVSHFDTQNVIHFNRMFLGCSKLKTINVSAFNTTNAVTMEAMFSGCTSVSELNFLNFTFEKFPSVSGMLGSVGSTAESYPIPIKVTEDGYTYLTQIANCYIDKTYAKLVKADGTDCDYEEDTKVFYHKTLAVKPEIDENGVYLISSAANLKWFMENCKYTIEEDYSSASYKLTTDIIFGNVSWKPIYFSGIFDGGNHSIRNLKPKGYEEGGYGFFRNMSGSVKNLILINPQITQTGDNDYYSLHSGFLAAQASGNIINCGVVGGSISVQSTSRAWVTGGGLVGYAIGNVVIKGCYVLESNIIGNHVRNGTYVGGLVGGVSSSNVVITSCYSKNLVMTGYGGGDIGSFIGQANSSTISINTCYYDNSVDAIGNTYSSDNIKINTFEAFTDDNFADAINRMNVNLTGCDYKFGTDGFFVKNSN